MKFLRKFKFSYVSNKKRGSAWSVKYDIMDEQHNTILKIQGPCCVLDGINKIMRFIFLFKVKMNKFIQK
jgi:hypothetical protein